MARLTGDPEPIERFADSTFWSGSCLLWGREIQSNGYGRFKIGPQYFRAHRWIYEHTFGTIPQDLVLDHLCRNRACVFIGHLEPVTTTENNRRARAATPKRTHCRRGHEYSGHNLKINSNGSRTCRACYNAAQRCLQRLSREVARG